VYNGKLSPFLLYNKGKLFSPLTLYFNVIALRRAFLDIQHSIMKIIIDTYKTACYIYIMKNDTKTNIKTGDEKHDKNHIPLERRAPENGGNH
jgi:hypothetical protein